MNKEKYNQIIDEVWKCFSNVRKSMLMLKPPASENKLREYIEWYEQITTKEEFINKCKTDPEFSERWGLKIKERELTLEERYNIWFTNNYETGMERYFDPNRLPDFDNEYYEPTPTKLITVTYNNQTIEVY